MKTRDARHETRDTTESLRKAVALTVVTCFAPELVRIEHAVASRVSCLASRIHSIIDGNQP